MPILKFLKIVLIIVYFFIFHYFLSLISCTRGILGSLQASNAGTTSIPMQSINGIQLEVSGARVLYDIKEYSYERNRTYSCNEGEKSNYLMKDDSQYNSKSSCSGDRIVGNEVNENGINVDIVKNNMTNRCNECNNYNVNKIKNIDCYDEKNLKITTSIDGIRENQKKMKYRKILSIASTLWGFGFIVE